MDAETVYNLLTEVLSYDPLTGIFRWRVRPNKCMKVGDVCVGHDTPGYTRFKLKGKTYSAHRVAWLFVHKRWPVDCIDHINGIRTDNRIENLRECTMAQNNANRTVRRRGGLKGAFYSKKSKRWRSIISVRNERIYLGQFSSEQEAHEACADAARKHHGEFASLR